MRRVQGHCKRYDCLYHPDFRECHNCEYMLLSGEKRNSEPGNRCTKYKHATSEEQSDIRRRRNVLMTDEEVWENNYESKLF